MSGADLANLANEAAITAARMGAESISMAHFNEAHDRKKMGAPKGSAALSDAAKERIAYHEAGHTLMSLHEGDKSNELDKVTIIPRSRALGLTVFTQNEDSMILPKYSEYITQLRVLAAGRIAEEIIYGSYTKTAGAHGDIQMMTNLARRMVTELGMSADLGMIKYTADGGNQYLGGNQSGLATGSSETAKAIDDEVKRLTDDAYKFAMEVMSDPQNIEQLHKLSAALIERETVEAAEVIEMLDIKEFADPHEKEVIEKGGLQGVGPNWQQYRSGPRP